MSLPGYQIELLLNDFRIKYGYKRVASHKIDALDISEEAQYEAIRIQTYIAKKKKQSGWISPEKILDLIADRTEYDSRIEHEQQRRAGLFVDPLYYPPNPPPPIAKVHEYTRAEQAEGSPVEVSPAVKMPVSEPIQEKKVEEKAELTPMKKGSSKTQSNVGNIIEDEEDGLDDLDITEEENRGDADSGVVYGMGRITRDAMIEFVLNHPDSAMKFIARRALDGKHLPVNVGEVHEEWVNRGLSRKRVRDYILEIMEWGKIPDEPLMDMWSSLRDRIYDVVHR